MTAFAGTSGRSSDDPPQTLGQPGVVRLSALQRFFRPSSSGAAAAEQCPCPSSGRGNDVGAYAAVVGSIAVAIPLGLMDHVPPSRADGIPPGRREVAYGSRPAFLVSRRVSVSGPCWESRALAVRPVADLNMTAHRSIGLVNVDRCPTCHDSSGEILHRAASDRWFGVPGSWAFRRCDACRGLWLDPRPAESALSTLYEQYYTHSSTNVHRSTASIWRKLLTHLPWHAADKQGDVGYIRGVPPGRVLDVGCGDGRRLARLTLDGWSAVGIDTDHRAVQAARHAFDGEVLCGTVHDIDDVAGYDAIVMFHVLEHVHDPLATLIRTSYLLRPGGTLSIATPNATSWLHDAFGDRWRGLEPPRHLQIFSKLGLITMLSEAGFDEINAMTTARNAGLLALASQTPPIVGRPVSTPVSLMKGELLQGVEWIKLHWSPDCGEELVAIATRPR